MKNIKQNKGWFAAGLILPCPIANYGESFTEG
jgi:hypothetical protein